MTRKRTRGTRTIRRQKLVRTRGDKARGGTAGKPARPDALDTMVASAAQLLKLPIDPAWRGGVKFNLQLSLRLAMLVDEFPLPDDVEPGPVFHA